MNALDYILGGDWYIATCDECRQSRSLKTEHERDVWERNHTHDGEYA